MKSFSIVATRILTTNYRERRCCPGENGKMMWKLLSWVESLCCFLTFRDEFGFCIFNVKCFRHSLDRVGSDKVFSKITALTGSLKTSTIFSPFGSLSFCSNEKFFQPSHSTSFHRHFYSFCCFHLEKPFIYINVVEAGKVFSVVFSSFVAGEKKNSLACESTERGSERIYYFLCFQEEMVGWFENARKGGFISLLSLALIIFLSLRYIFLLRLKYFTYNGAPLDLRWAENEREARNNFFS